jgi:hypothetical protein
MPYMIANRPRWYDTGKDRSDLRVRLRWETINAIPYKIGGLIFIFGSILFFPTSARYYDISAWVFFGGSLIYLVVTVHDLRAVYGFWHKTPHLGLGQSLEYIAASAYVFGTILFTVSSVFFLTEAGMFRAGAWCFVMGSLMFVMGACINVLQILNSGSIITLQLMNLTAVSFVMGSLLFTVASVPYLWEIQSAADKDVLYTFLAWQYLIGSVLFFIGGVFNYWRAFMVMR